MRVLYVGSLGPTATSSHRRSAIRRLGHEVIDFDTDPYQDRGGHLLSAIRLRLLRGPAVERLNRDLLDTAARQRLDLVWFDKAVFVKPGTVRQLRAGGAVTVHFNIDNPFGPRGDPGWRLILDAVPEYDLHLVQRDCNLADYRAAGARDVFLMRTAYEPTVHFPPPAEWSDADRPYDVVFVGHPYDERPRFVTDLWRRHGIAVHLWGSAWPRVLSAEERSALWHGPGVFNEHYRETLWRSRICLSFVTHSNRDDVAHKSFEIAACGCFLLAEDTPGHRAHFLADQEAVFFRSVDDCAEKIHRYLVDERGRQHIADAGRRRCEASGYSNDGRIEQALDYLQSRLMGGSGS